MAIVLESAFLSSSKQSPLHSLWGVTSARENFLHNEVLMADREKFILLPRFS